MLRILFNLHFFFYQLSIRNAISVLPKLQILVLSVEWLPEVDAQGKTVTLRDITASDAETMMLEHPALRSIKIGNRGFVV